MEGWKTDGSYNWWNEDWWNGDSGRMFLLSDYFIYLLYFSDTKCFLRMNRIFVILLRGIWAAPFCLCFPAKQARAWGKQGDRPLCHLLKWSCYFFIFKAALCREFPDLKINIHCFTCLKLIKIFHSQSLVTSCTKTLGIYQFIYCFIYRA